MAAILSLAHPLHSKERYRGSSLCEPGTLGMAVARVDLHERIKAWEVTAINSEEDITNVKRKKNKKKKQREQWDQRPSSG